MKDGYKRLFIMGIWSGIMISLIVIISLQLFGVIPRWWNSDLAGDVEERAAVIEHYIDNYYWKEKVSDEKMAEYAMKGMVSALGDKYSTYYTEEEYKQSINSVNGDYCGIGATVRRDSEKKRTYIEEVQAGKPAERAGLQAGDEILRVDGTDVTELKERELARFRRENLGFIFQDFNLLDTLTISENIALALTINRVPADAIGAKVAEMAAALNISDILDKYPYQVSGGQRQRCACARALVNKPKLILADEPTGALDSHSSQMLMATLQSISEQLGATILMVTHDVFSASYADRILFLRDGAIFTEIRRGRDSRKVLFEKILGVLTMMGGGQSDVR